MSSILSTLEIFIGRKNLFRLADGWNRPIRLPPAQQTTLLKTINTFLEKCRVGVMPQLPYAARLQKCTPS